MITVRRFDNTLRQDWDAFVRRSKNGHFMHQRDYMEYHSERFADHSLLFLEDSRIIGLLPANIEQQTLFSHQGLTFGGVISDVHMTQSKMLTIFDSLSSFCREHSIRELVYKAIPYIYHRTPAQEDLYALFRHNAELFRVDSSSTIDLRQPVPMAQGKKSGANKASRAGVHVARIEDLQDFFHMISTRLNERYSAAATHTAAEMMLLKSRFPDNIIAYGAFSETRLIAGTLLFLQDPVVHAQYISSTDEGRHLRAVDYLIRHLLLDVYPDKYFFDFGISNEQQGRFLNDSLIRQKEEFGGRTVTHLFYKLHFATE